jgi:hypothetical protein
MVKTEHNTRKKSFLLRLPYVNTFFVLISRKRQRLRMKLTFSIKKKYILVILSVCWCLVRFFSFLFLFPFVINRIKLLSYSTFTRFVITHLNFRNSWNWFSFEIVLCSIYVILLLPLENIFQMSKQP